MGNLCTEMKASVREGNKLYICAYTKLLTVALFGKRELGTWEEGE